MVAQDMKLGYHVLNIMLVKTLKELNVFVISEVCALASSCRCCARGDRCASLCQLSLLMTSVAICIVLQES